jgi:hypothetical protein
MPRPITLGNAVYHLNIRVPAHLADKLRGTKIMLPVDHILRRVSISDKVVLSLRTKDPGIAKTRFNEAYSALLTHFGAVHAGPSA